MKIGVSVQNYGSNPSREFLKTIALEIERNDLDSIWTSDHIIVKKTDKPWNRVFDSLTTLSFFAGITEKVELGTSILLAPLRNPLVVGKQIATLDNLSNGRLLVGIGIGWNKFEFEKLGINFTNRVKIAEKAVEEWRKLWNGGFEKEGYMSEPLPIQPGGPPILIGGQSNPAIKRVAKIGDGWHPVGVTPEVFQKGKEKIILMKKKNYLWSLRVAFAANKNLESTYIGTDGTPRVRLVGDSSQIIKKIEKYKKAGVEHLVCDIREGKTDDCKSQVRILSEIASVFR